MNIKLSKEDVLDEISKDNLLRFQKMLYIDETELSSEGKNKFMKNLNIMDSVSKYIGKQKKGTFSKDVVLDLIGLNDGVITNVLAKRKEELKPYLSRILKIKSNLDKFLNQYRVQIEVLDNTEEDNTEVEEELNFETEEEEYEYHLEKALDKIMKQFDKGDTSFLRSKNKETGSLEDKAERDAKIYIYSDGNVRPTQPENIEREIYEGVKAFHDEMKNKVSHVIAKEQVEGLSKREKKEQTLSEYLDKVTDVVLEGEEEIERRKNNPQIPTKEKEEKQVTLYSTN